jgi:subtilisin family serine protease
MRLIIILQSNAEIMKILILYTCMSLFALDTFAQDYYYYFNEQRSITLSDNKIVVSWNESYNQNKLENLESNLGLHVLDGAHQSNPYTVYQIQKGSLKEIVEKLQMLPFVNAIEPVVESKGYWVASSNNFYVKVNNLADLQEAAKSLNFKIIKENEFIHNWYLCESLNKGHNNSITICNYLYEKGIAAITDPGWVIKFKPICVNDPDFSKQWGLSNNGLDVEACKAWDISKGRPEVVIAVIDYGIDLANPEFAANLSSFSFDAVTATSPSVIQHSSGHGTHCAGIIGANQDNNLQVTGIAPNCALMSISSGLGSGSNPTFELALAFNIAGYHDADVISNSWAAQDAAGILSLQSSWLENAISHQINYGRGGLGCTVVFGVGNDESQPIGYPANFSKDIICVGAMNEKGKRLHVSSTKGSAFGSELDVVAPGENVFSTDLFNSITSKDGTSQACPMVSGIAGLVLSVNRCLTHDQVKLIIEASCKKVGPYCYSYFKDHPTSTWNNEMGYGLVDAFAAVQMAFSLNTNQFLASSGVDQGASAKFKLGVNGAECISFATGVYYAKRHEIKHTITYPYTQAPLLVGSTNGVSGSNPNTGNPHFNVLSISETTATVNTFVYEIITAISGSSIGQWFPCAPSNVLFNLNVLSSMQNDAYLQNLNLTGTAATFNAINTIESGKNVTSATAVGPYIVDASSDATFRAGKQIFLRDGFSAKNGSKFKAYINPFFTCKQFPNGRTAQPFDALDTLKDLRNETSVNITDANIIYPNPTRDFVILTVNVNDAIQISVQDLTGKSIQCEVTTVSANSNVKKLKVDLSPYPSGSYIIRSSNKLRQNTFLVMKE